MYQELCYKASTYMELDRIALNNKVWVRNFDGDVRYFMIEIKSHPKENL